MMWLRIAARDGIPVRVAQERYDSAEFAEQWAFHLVEPPVSQRVDMAAGLIQRAILGVDKYGRWRLPLDKAVPKWGPTAPKAPTKPMPEDTMKSMLKAWADAMNRR
jgi:hypothetical protein